MTATREDWTEQVREHRDDSGRIFRYVHVQHPGSRGLVVHFSAFFGEWGDTRAYRRVYSGHFHRLRMLGEVADHDWLFLCDEFGADGNGTYYAGKAGDLFVERAMLDVIRSVMAVSETKPSSMVTLGSSMGGTAALKFGLILGVRGVVAVSPHIDLDICAVRQGRWRHVAYICPDGDPVAVHNHVYTRQIRRLISPDRIGALPRLFVQACVDDEGVYGEQVVPLCAAWTSAGGRADLDARDHGGHTSDYATKPLLLDVVARLLDDRPIEIRRYQRDRRFRSRPASATLARWLRANGGRFLRSIGLRSPPAEPRDEREARIPSEPPIGR